MGGTPVFTGTGVPIQTLFDYMGLRNIRRIPGKFSISKKGPCYTGALEMARKTPTTEKILNDNFA